MSNQAKTIKRYAAACLQVPISAPLAVLIAASYCACRWRTFQVLNGSANPSFNITMLLNNAATIIFEHSKDLMMIGIY
jgi:hypothetical protein